MPRNTFRRPRRGALEIADSSEADGTGSAIGSPPILTGAQNDSARSTVSSSWASTSGSAATKRAGAVAQEDQQPRHAGRADRLRGAQAVDDGHERVSIRQHRG